MAGEKAVLEVSSASMTSAKRLRAHAAPAQRRPGWAQRSAAAHLSLAAISASLDRGIGSAHVEAATTTTGSCVIRHSVQQSARDAIPGSGRRAETRARTRKCVTRRDGRRARTPARVPPPPPTSAPRSNRPRLGTRRRRARLAPQDSSRMTCASSATGSACRPTRTAPSGTRPPSCSPRASIRVSTSRMSWPNSHRSSRHLTSRT